MNAGEFSFRLSPDKIREFKDLPADQKLDWLEEAGQFVRIAVSREKLERWERLKKESSGKAAR